MVQNAAAHLESMRRKHNSISDVIVNLHWLRVEARIIFKMLVLVYKCMHDMAPESWLELIHVKDLCVVLDVY